MYSYGSFSYSCDKIELKCRLKKYNGDIPHKSKIRTWIEFCLPDWIECTHSYESMQPFRYRYAYDLKVKGSKEGVFHVREWYNGDFKEQKQIPEAFFIGYNPNKEGSRIYREFRDNFIFDIVEIVSFDIAYDVPEASVKDVYINTRADVMTYGKTDNKTLYIAPKEDKSGRVKVYNKDKERERLGIEKERTLRIEASIKCKGLDFNTIHVSGDIEKELQKTVDHINSVHIRNDTVGVTDWKLYALLNLPPGELENCLALMTAPTKRNYKKLVNANGYYTLELDVPTFVVHISNILKPYQQRIKIK